MVELALGADLLRDFVRVFLDLLIVAFCAGILPRLGFPTGTCHADLTECNSRLAKTFKGASELVF